MTIFRERDRRAEDRKRRSRGGGRGETKAEIRPPSVGRGGRWFRDDERLSKGGGWGVDRLRIVRRAGRKGRW